MARLAVVQQVGDHYRLVARTGLSRLNFDFVPSEDTGSDLLLTTVPVGPTASALAVTLRTSRGNDDFGDVLATTVLYAVQDSALRAVLDLETESVHSEMTLGRQAVPRARGTTTTLVAGTGTAAALKDLVATTTEFTAPGSARSLRRSTTATFLWDAEQLEYRSNTPDIRPIRLASGASSVDVSGAVARGERAIYSIDAARGQSLTLDITADEQNAVFQLYLPGARVSPARDGVSDIAGRTLPGAGEGEDATHWNGILPEAGLYLIVVGGTRGNASFRLTVGVQ